MHFPTGRSQEPWKKCLSPGLSQELYRISLGSVVATERRKINNNAVFKMFENKDMSAAEETATGLRWNDFGR